MSSMFRGADLYHFNEQECTTTVNIIPSCIISCKCQSQKLFVTVSQIIQRHAFSRLKDWSTSGGAAMFAEENGSEGVVS